MIKANETWYQKFGPLSNPYEECRADSVALYFCTIKEVCEILCPEQIAEFDDFSYASWLGNKRNFKIFIRTKVLFIMVSAHLSSTFLKLKNGVKHTAKVDL